MNRILEIIELLDYVVDTSEKTGNRPPYGALKRSLSDLRQLVQNTDSEIPTETKIKRTDENSQMRSGAEKRNGLASRIKPVPAEVRGRVRELVDLISDDTQFDDSIESTQ